MIKPRQATRDMVYRGPIVPRTEAPREPKPRGYTLHKAPSKRSILSVCVHGRWFDLKVGAR